jgi:hypothetical protein
MVEDINFGENHTEYLRGPFYNFKTSSDQGSALGKQKSYRIGSYREGFELQLYWIGSKEEIISTVLNRIVLIVLNRIDR